MVQLSKIYELTEIVKQSSDLSYLKYLIESEKVAIEMMMLEKQNLWPTHNSHWPNDFLKVYLTNGLANIVNERWI